MLVYRSVWSDKNLAKIQFLDAATAWLLSRGRAVTPQENKRVTTRSEQLDTWVIDSPNGLMVRLRLKTPRQPTGEIWTTTATLIKGLTDTDVWVDVNVDLADISQRRISAPGLVKNLLLSGGTPSVGSDSLEVQPSEIGDAQSVFDLFRWLRSDERKLPVVLFAPHRTQSHLVKQRATRASEILAGLAAVSVIERLDLAGQFNSLVEPELFLTPGDVLLVMPGVSDNPGDPRLLFRLIVEDLSPNPRDPGELIAHRLGQTSQWPDVPKLWPRFKELIFPLPSEGDLHSFGETQPLDDENTRLRTDAEQRIDDLLSMTQLLEEKDQEIETLHDVLTQLLVNNPEIVIPLSSRPKRRRSVSKVIEDARSSLGLLSIPNGAEQKIDELDSLLQSETWAKDLERALGALQHFATVATKRSPNSDFFSWCQRTGLYPHTKVAMHEAESTKNDHAAMSARSFPVTVELSDSGRCIMEAHVKIQEKGNRQIPRMYFLDDTRGATKQIHIGFIGPHYLVQHGNWR